MNGPEMNGRDWGGAMRVWVLAGFAMLLTGCMQAMPVAEAPAQGPVAKTPAPQRQIVCAEDLDLAHEQAMADLRQSPEDYGLQTFIGLIQEQRGFTMDARGRYFRIIDGNSEEMISLHCGDLSYVDNAVADIAQDRLFELDNRLRMLGVSEEQLAIGEPMAAVAATPTEPEKGGGYLAHFATYSTERRAKSKLLEVARELGREVGAREYFMMPVVLDPSGMMFRIGVKGFADRDAVVRFCSSIRVRGQECAPLLP